MWPLWTLGAGLAVSSHPLYNLILCAVVALVVTRCHDRGPFAAGWGLFVRLGLVLLLLRLLLSVVAVGGLSYGATPLVRLPQLQLPLWLGGLALGGPATVEMLVQGLVGGIRLATLLVVFGALNVLADHYALLRRTPRWLFGAGLVVVIALAWVPQTLLHFVAVREAQRLRGGAARGWRMALPLALSLLAGGLERATQLAEAMDSRGYGRTVRPGARRLGDQLVLLAGTTMLALGLWASLADRRLRLPGWAGVLAGLAVLAVAIHQLRRGVAATRYTREHWQAADGAVVAAALLMGLVFVGLRAAAPASLRYTPFPVVLLPSFMPWIGLLPMALLLPAALAPLPSGP